MGKSDEKKISLNVPQTILELANKFAKERIAKERAEKERKETEEAKRKRVRAERLQSGLEYATKVFLWAEALRTSGPGAELMRKAHIPTTYSTIIFFDGHIKGVEWVGLGISPNGMFWTRGGRFSVIARKPIASPEDLAMSVETKIVKMASEWIDNGQVWECILRRFDYLKEKKS